MTEKRKAGRKSARPLVVVTGASSGIGEAFARRFASDGYDLLVVARREDRLKALAAELQEKNGVTVEGLSLDLTDETKLRLLEEKIARADRIQCLVNNAGFMTHTTFVESDADAWEAMVRLHVLATVRLTHAALPGMIAHGRGNIINLGSVAGFFPLPRQVLYVATKAFVLDFTETLHQELDGTGVRVQALCPGWTRTELLDRPGFDKSAITDPWWGTADEAVDYSLKSLKRGRLLCIPGWHYRLLVRVTRMLPRALLRWTIRKNITRMDVVTTK